MIQHLTPIILYGIKAKTTLNMGSLLYVKLQLFVYRM